MKISALFAILSAISSFATAAPVTFQFKTTINATDVGGGANEPLVITYTFDSNLANGTGGSSINANIGSYGPIVVRLQAGGQTLYGTAQSGITVYNDNGDGDQYAVQAEDFSGSLFGSAVSTFTLLIVDPTGGMFSSTALPTNPQFAAAGKFQQTYVASLAILEDANTPASERRTFSLAVAAPLPPLVPIAGRYSGTVRQTIAIDAAATGASSLSKVSGRIAADGSAFFFLPGGTVVRTSFGSNGAVSAGMRTNGVPLYNLDGVRVVGGVVSKVTARSIQFTVAAVEDVYWGPTDPVTQTDKYEYSLVRVGN